MFEKEDTIHFACTQCGKCCEKSPSSNFYDMFSLADEFVFQTSHHPLLSYEKKPQSEELTQFYRMIGHTLVLPELEAVLFYYINFMSLEYPQATCSKLKDNLCSIYSKRPSSCKLTPISDFFDDTEQWKTINFFKKKVEQNKWECDFSVEAPILYKNEQIYSLHHNSLYFNSIGINKDFTDKYVMYIKNSSENHFKNHFKSVINVAINNSQMITDMIIPLVVGLREHFLDEDKIVDFVEKQIILIEKEMGKSSLFKIKDNLKISRLYNKQKNEYKKALKNNLFRLENDNFGII